MQKKCPKCVEGRCKKNGIRHRKQRYRCVNCGHAFGGKIGRLSKTGVNEEMYDLYCFKNRTYE